MIRNADGFGLRPVALAFALAALGLLSLVAKGPAQAGESPETVTLSGNVYAFIFGGNESRLEGAVIRIEEIPGLQTVAGPNGAWSLEVPNDTTVTPYAEFPDYYTTHIQTFHTRDNDLRQVNFQMPEFRIYRLLAGIAQAETDPETELLTKCGIVSTFFQKEGRSFSDFDDLHDFRPHGVIGSTASLDPEVRPPTYFNSNVYPDPQQPSSSRDGGVLWTNVPTGVYQVSGVNPATRHASFVATCEPGRLVNANPPWGLYELAGNEETNPATLPGPEPIIVDKKVRAWAEEARVIRKRGITRSVKFRMEAREQVAWSATVNASGQVIGRREGRLPAGNRRSIRALLVPRSAAGPIRLTVEITDDDGNLRRQTWFPVAAARG